MGEQRTSLIAMRPRRLASKKKKNFRTAVTCGAVRGAVRCAVRGARCGAAARRGAARRGAARCGAARRGAARRGGRRQEASPCKSAQRLRAAR